MLLSPPVRYQTLWSSQFDVRDLTCMRVAVPMMQQKVSERFLGGSSTSAGRRACLLLTCRAVRAAEWMHAAYAMVTHPSVPSTSPPPFAHMLQCLQVHCKPLFVRPLNPSRCTYCGGACHELCPHMPSSAVPGGPCANIFYGLQFLSAVQVNL